MRDNFRPARLSKNFKYIIDCDNNKIKFNDPRVVHVYASMTNDYLVPMFNEIIKRRGWNSEPGYRITSEIMEFAKTICSGRECLSYAIVSGCICKHMAESLQKDKIYVYYMVDQEGPCQIGAWPATWDTFIKRKNLTNVVISGHPRLYNNYLGQGLSFGSENMICVIISDLLDQAKNVLKCLAVDKELALKTFETETESVIKSAAKGIVPVIHSFRKWAHNISKIPLKASVEETPKVCIFGGGVLSLMHQQLCDYFCNEGIIPKVVDFSEWIIYVESEAMLRLSFKKGYMGIEKKYRIIPYFMAFLNPRNNFKELYLGVSSRITGITQLNMQKYFLRIARKSGLIYDSFVSFFDMIREGNKYVPYDAFCEAIVTIGRYLCSLKAGIFDGYVHAAVFNCQPSIDAQAILKSLSIRSDAPFISLDFENHVLTSYHMRLLEAVAVKAKYGRQVRNNSGAERVS